MAKPAGQSNKILWLDCVFGMALLFGFSEVATAKNSSSPTVKQAQEALRSQGLCSCTIDGIPGQQTKDALRRFQRAHGLPETGTLDQLTMTKLLPNPETNSPVSGGSQTEGKEGTKLETPESERKEATKPETPESERKEGTLTDVDTQHPKMTVAIPQTITVIGENREGKLGTLHKGDVVRFDATNNNEVQAASVLIVNKIVAVSGYCRLLAGLLAFALVMLVASFFAQWNLGGYFVGLDNRTSNSQTQFALWSATVFVAYLTTVFLRVWEGWIYLDARQLQDVIGGVEIPTNLLAISGLSALSFVGARAVTTSKIASAKAKNALKPAGAPDRVPEKKPNPGSAKFLDLFLNDPDQKGKVENGIVQNGKVENGKGENGIRKVDLGDTQMILITFIAIVIYVFKTYAFLGQIELSPHVTLPDLDTTLLSAFGIGQGAYLGKKAGSDLGEG